MSIGQKIFAGFGVVLFLFSVTVAIAFSRLGTVAHLAAISQKSLQDDAFLIQKEVDHLNWSSNLATALLQGKDPDVQMDPTQCGFGKWLYSSLDSTGKYPAEVLSKLKEIEPLHRALHESAAKIRSAPATDRFHLYTDITLPALKSVQGKLKEIRGAFESQVLAVAGEAAKDLAATTLFARNFVLIVGILSLLIGGVLAFLIARSIIGPITGIIGTLSNASEEVAKTSDQIAQSSEELSQASNEQAASLQETSSSIEELTAMVQKNSESAALAAGNTQKSMDSAKSGKETVEKMVLAIQELERSNQQIAEIVKVFGEIQDKTKVIDDIVFQTQLLSFNASVEAARAGEHGKGFAVVAEEVGNLAEMSGNASNEIGTLLGGSLKKVEGTVDELREKISRLVEQAGQGISALNSIVQEAVVASAKTGEIATASGEQSRGIEEINRAMGQLEQSTQQNAATSEETASASEELSKQAESLKTTVDQLVKLVHGNTKKV